MDTCLCLSLVLIIITITSLLPLITDAAPSLQPEEWVSVSSCRLQCVNKFLVSASGSQHHVTEDTCMKDDAGCFECWKMCENLLAKPLEFADTCDANSLQPANSDGESDTRYAVEGEYDCTVGCTAACDAHAAIDKRFYASPDAEKSLIAEPLLDFYNSTALFVNLDIPVGATYVYLILYRMHAEEDWTQLLSTFQQPIPVYGSFYNYPGLQLRFLTVARDGVIGDAMVDLYKLAAAVTDPATTPPQPTPPSGAPVADPGSTTIPIADIPTTSSSIIENEYQRMFNHYMDLLTGSGRSGSSGGITRSSNTGSATSSNASNTIVYISVAVVSALVIAVIIVGVIVLRSNNQLAKSLSRRASSFRTSFRRSVRRSVRGLSGARGGVRRPIYRYDVARAAASNADVMNGTDATSNVNASPSDVTPTEQEMQPMVVPLLCVSTPNLHAANLLNVSPLKLQATSLSNIHAVNPQNGEPVPFIVTSETPTESSVMTSQTTDEFTKVAMETPPASSEESTQSDSIVVIMADGDGDADSNC